MCYVYIWLIVQADKLWFPIARIFCNQEELLKIAHGYMSLHNSLVRKVSYVARLINKAKVN